MQLSSILWAKTVKSLDILGQGGNMEKVRPQTAVLSSSVPLSTASHQFPPSTESFILTVTWFSSLPILPVDFFRFSTVQKPRTKDWILLHKSMEATVIPGTTTICDDLNQECPKLLSPTGYHQLFLWDTCLIYDALPIFFYFLALFNIFVQWYPFFSDLICWA